jgi:hypothetical protein
MSSNTEAVMRLSASQFERILKADVAAASNGRPAVVPVGCRVSSERRAVARVSLGRRIQMRVGGADNNGRWQTVVVRDVSETGLSLLTDAEFAAEDLLVVRFQTGPGQHLCLEAKVCWSEPGGYERAGHLVGAAFERVIERQAFVLQGSSTGGTRPEQAEQAFDLKPAPDERRKRFGLGITAVALLEAGRSLLGRRSAAG